MAERKWNKEQLEAITAFGGDLLVSAAAGSGKTAVLVERIIRMLTREENPVDADRILAVTFTNLAAAEMKTRINAALTELIEQSPDDRRLRRQQLLMERAHIATISSFCLDVVRESFSTLGLSPDFRAMDEQEKSAVSAAAIEETFENAYAENDPARAETIPSLRRPCSSFMSTYAAYRVMTTGFRRKPLCITRKFRWRTPPGAE